MGFHSPICQFHQLLVRDSGGSIWFCHFSNTIFLIDSTFKRGWASIKQIWNIVASRPKFVFSRTFIFCIPICPDNCGVVFLWKYILVFEKWIFSFDRSNMQIFTVNITRVVWPHVTNVLDLRYFCEHNPLFYHLNLIPCRYWSWQRNIYFLVNIFVRHTFPVSKSSIKQRQF